MNTDENKDNIQKKLRIEFFRPEECKQVYSIGAIGGHSPYDFRIGFYNDNPMPALDENGVQVMQRKLETEVILSPLAALELSKWLNQHLKEYESVFGIIPHPPKVEIKDEIINTNNRKDPEIQGYI